MITLYVLMVIAIVIALWANFQGKARGAPWGRPLAALCGIVSIVLAFSAILVSQFGSGGSNKEARQKEAQYQYIAYKFFGQKIAEKHSGTTMLVVERPEFGAQMSRTDDKVESIPAAQERGLKDGLGSTVVISRTVQSLPPEKVQEIRDRMSEMRGSADGSGPPMEYEMMYGMEGEGLTVERFDLIMEENADIGVFYFKVPLPYGLLTESKWLKRVDRQVQAGKSIDEFPSLVLSNAAQLSELRPLIEAGLITVVLHNYHNPDYDWEAEVPEDEQTAFNLRFVLITTDNIEQVAKEHPKLFPKKD